MLLDVAWLDADRKACRRFPWPPRRAYFSPLIQRSAECLVQSALSCLEKGYRQRVKWGSRSRVFVVFVMLPKPTVRGGGGTFALTSRWFVPYKYVLAPSSHRKVLSRKGYGTLAAFQSFSWSRSLEDGVREKQFCKLSGVFSTCTLLSYKALLIWIISAVELVEQSSPFW